MLSGDHRVIQVLPPLRQLGLDALGTFLEHPSRPQVVALQVPAEVVSLNRAKWCREGETSTLDPTRRGIGRLICQCGRGRHPTFPVSGLDVWIAQLQQ